ncbi:glycosyltransferase family 2 protein [Lactococcus insecticola]|uniref:Glycosyltransferase 2-like domain-containing protein n=1 Tax=Pseudolactococcus insecticola TaxID=2709158 RepID=A0A6A0B6M0_9LACT|nr:glycosyltransferase [Lactococcus insecticola]GFH40158.1 hypothetical protein Hs20B_05560 [Lactococcus insecticola]
MAYQKLVSIIIPYHSEDVYRLNVVLSSINNQIGVDFEQIEVILVGDAPVEAVRLSDFVLLQHLDLQMHVITGDSVGAGLARQAGMDLARGQYLMFMDADDQFQFVGSLLEFFNVAKMGNHDMIIARYLEESYYNGAYRYYTSSARDWKAAYGKWFSVDYLARIGLKWHPNLRIYEDTYFVGIAATLSPDTHYIDSVVYTRMYNATSTVRKDDYWFERQHHTWADENRYWLQFMRFHRPERMLSDLNYYLVDVYFRRQVNASEDDALFWEAHKRLVLENRDIWAGYTPELATYAESLQDREDKYKAFSLDGLSDFIASSEQFLRD